MACLKCGKKTADDQSFCPRCLEVMEAYPVKPDVHIQLPNRPAVTESKKPFRKRRILSYEEATIVWRRRTRWLAALVLLLAFLLGVVSFFLAKEWLTEEEIPLGNPFSSGQTLD